MATTQSTEKVLKFLNEKENPVSKTEIVQACALPSVSVGQILELLTKMNQVEIWTNGKTSLIKRKSIQNAIPN